MTFSCEHFPYHIPSLRMLLNSGYSHFYIYTPDIALHSSSKPTQDKSVW